VPLITRFKHTFIPLHEIRNNVLIATLLVQVSLATPRARARAYTA